MTRSFFPYVLLAAALLVDIATWSDVSVSDRSTHVTVLLAGAAIVVAIHGGPARSRDGHQQVSRPSPPGS